MFAISQMYNLYEKDKQLLRYSPKTLKGYKIQSNLLVRYFGDIDIRTITIDMIKDYLIAQDHLKASSLGARVRFLKSFFRYCFEERYIDDNIGKYLKEPKVGSRIPKYLTEKEIIILDEHCIKPIEKALINFTYATGCRVGEVEIANISDIDWNRRALNIIGKGDVQRETYFNVKTEYWLQRYLDNRNDDCEALFVTERRPYRRLSIDMIRIVMKRVAKRTGLNINLYPHRYRHSHSITLYNNGMPIEEIRDNLGHVNIRTTMSYLCLTGEHRRQEYNKYFR